MKGSKIANSKAGGKVALTDFPASPSCLLVSLLLKYKQAAPTWDLFRDMDW